MTDEIDRALAKAIYPNIRSWADSKFTDEVLKRAQQARKRLLAAGYSIQLDAEVLLKKDVKVT